ncbi:MAG: DUF1266 domain-containing protein [Planctomycetes bacterium]|nr:DUF1266 domain-containing protein [Planctomycetota bacterium]
MLASITTVILVAAAALVSFVALAFGALYFLSSRMVKAVEASMADDAKHPARAWVQVAFGFINFRDPAYLSGDIACKASLKRDWGIESSDGLLQRAEKLKLMMPANPAWHGTRLINMYRIGAGAGYVGEGESWDLAIETAARLREGYGSWEELAESMRAALDEQKGEWVAAAKQSFEANAARLKACNYRGVKFAEPEGPGPSAEAAGSGS